LINLRLSNSKEPNLLIIDEAGKFIHNQLLFLHEIRDNTKNNTKIILTGPTYFKKNLDDWKLAGKDRIPELHRRVEAGFPLQEPSLKEKRACYSEYGILNQLADELSREWSDFGTLDNKILETRIALLKFLKMQSALH